MATRSNTQSVINKNRLVTVGVGTVLWVGCLKLLIPSIALGVGVVLSLWIALGSHLYARAVADFARPLTAKTLFGLALLSPGWPLLYWYANQHATQKPQRKD